MQFAVVPEEVGEKDRRVRELLAARGWNGLLLSLRANFAWATCGRYNHISRGTESGAGYLLYTADGGKYLLCNVIEEERLRNEEALEAQGFTFVSGPWHTFSVGAGMAKLVSGTLGADFCPPGVAAHTLSPQDLSVLRYSLTPPEVERYRWLGRTVSEALETTAQAIEPGMAEFEVAALLNHFLEDERILPNVTLIAAEERISLYRHPLPTARTVEKKVMLVIGATAFGLVASATRLVSFGPVDDEWSGKHTACCYVDAVLNLSTLPGASVAEIFAKGQTAYAEQKWPEEWEKHHQGGATGYAGREYLGVPGSPHTVLLNQAFAWNPSITGTKSEDTILATESGIEVLTACSSEWPTLCVETPFGAMDRPDILEREP